MALKTINFEWEKNFRFKANVRGHRIDLDLPKSLGGADKGGDPTEMMLVALGSCSGISTVMILDRMQVGFESLAITASGETTSETELPVSYIAMRLVFRFEGADIDPDKVAKAVEMAHDKYCSVTQMYQKICPISYQVQINGVTIRDSEKN